MENLTETIIGKLEQTGMPKEELKININKLHRTGPYQSSTNTQPVIVKFKITVLKKNLQQAKKCK